MDNMVTIRYFYNSDDEDDALEAPPDAVMAALRGRLREDGLSMDPAYPVVRGDRSPVTLIEDAPGFVPWNGTGFPDGYLVEWTCAGVEPHEDSDPVGVVTAGNDGSVDVALPPEALVGGGFRVEHGLGDPDSFDVDSQVVVTAFAGDDPVGYLFAQAVSAHVEHVELAALTTRLHIIRRPVPDA